MNLFEIILITISINFHETFCENNLDRDDLFESSHDTFTEDDYAYDHNSILGRGESQKFDKMSPEESKMKFSEIIDKMDKNHDGNVDASELKGWIKNVYDKILQEDVDQQWLKFVPAGNEKIDFDYYVKQSFGEKRSVDQEKLMRTEKRRWATADLDKDNVLNKTELFRFLHPEEFKDMRPLIAEETLEEMDKNNDSVIDINEYLSDIFPAGREAKEDWIRNERQNFGIERDLNKDGVMDRDEIQNWLMPESYNRVDAEARHLIEMADENRDQVLSKAEMLDKYYIFVGSQQSEPFGHPEQSHQDL